LPGALNVLARSVRRQVLTKNLVDQRPTYGYKRIAALLKREPRSTGRQPDNAKRIFRLMKKHGLLLQRYTGRRRPGEHDGKIITIRSNIRWCAEAPRRLRAGVAPADQQLTPIAPADAGNGLKLLLEFCTG
jgi:hypothetical protein